jgi:hypothetical protein
MSERIKRRERTLLSLTHHTHTHLTHTCHTEPKKARKSAQFLAPACRLIAGIQHSRFSGFGHQFHCFMRTFCGVCRTAKLPRAAERVTECVCSSEQFIISRGPLTFHFPLRSFIFQRSLSLPPISPGVASACYIDRCC